MYYIALMKKWNIVLQIFIQCTYTCHGKKCNYLHKIQIELDIDIIFYCFVYTRGDYFCGTFEPFDYIHY